jgi:hypothetical protein
MDSCYRSHDLELPSGRVVRYQGYENLEIKWLLQSIPEEEVLFEGEIKFPWVDSFGVSHVYYPDIALPIFKISIEVNASFNSSLSIETNTVEVWFSTDYCWNW